MRIEQLESLNHRFNGGAWQTEKGNLKLLLRHVEKSGENGEPDRGDLVLVELNDHRNIKERVVWSSQPNLNLEDPRVIRRKTGGLLIGLTAVVTENKKHIPYPAFIEIDDQDWEDLLPPVYIAKSLGPGKNTTPIGDQTYLFRPEDQTHKFRVVSWNGQNTKLGDEIAFDQPIPYWAKYKIGIASPPIWLDQKKGLMFLHGVSIKEGIYHYALTPAWLNRHNGSFGITVADKPLLTPDLLQENSHPKYQELHPEKRVVYLCGALMYNGCVNLYVNVGDTQTVLVTYSLQELIGQLRRNS